MVFLYVVMKLKWMSHFWSWLYPGRKQFKKKSLFKEKPSGEVINDWVEQQEPIVVISAVNWKFSWEYIKESYKKFLIDPNSCRKIVKID